MLHKIGDWRQLNDMLTVTKLNNRIKKFGAIATKKAGLVVVRNIRKKMRQINSPPNHPVTIMRKGSTKPLMDRGDLFNAITSIQLSPLDVWVGVPTGTFHRDSGISLASIAKVLEGGAIGESPRDTIILPRTAKALFIPLRRDVKPKDPGLIRGEDFILASRVRIRPRPFIGPGIVDSQKDVLFIYEAAVSAAFRSFL